MRFGVPESVIASVSGRPASAVVDVVDCPLDGGTGAATSGLARLTVRVRGPRGVDEFRLVRKVFRPLRSGRHRHGADDCRHWAYWRREPLAYASDVLPRGPGLRTPRCHGVFDSTIYLEDVGGAPVDAGRAARQLGLWQSAATVPDVPWLGGHQLAQRIDASALDWSSVRADPRAVALWDARDGLLAALSDVPVVLSHGDFHHGNLRTDGPDTVVFDWGTLGLAPVGADLAHLALSTQQDLQDEYLAGLGGALPGGSGHPGVPCHPGPGRCQPRSLDAQRGHRCAQRLRRFPLGQAPGHSQVHSHVAASHGWRAAGFRHTETWPSLSEVKGLPCQSANLPSSSSPASCAIRSHSAGQM
jgi:hypothetical protein